MDVKPSLSSLQINLAGINHRIAFDSWVTFNIYLYIYIRTLILPLFT